MKQLYVAPHAYSDGVCDKTIAIIGIQAPPLGGISVHVERVASKLRRQGNRVLLFDTEKRRRGFLGFVLHELRLIRFLITSKPDIVYHHTLTCFFRGRLLELFLMLCCKPFLGYQLVMVDHVSRFFKLQSWVYKKMANVLFRGLDAQVLIGSSTYATYSDQGIFLGNAWSVEAAFLPPDCTQEQNIIALYLPAVQLFLQNHTPVLLANASKLVAYQGNGIYAGKELYGFDLALEMLAVVKKRHPRVGLILALSGAGDEQRFELLKKTIEKNESVYLMYQCQSELWPLFKQVDLFLRPTLSDGASISVQEALFFDVPVVASDVCERPAGARVFKTGDVEDCVEKVLEVLNEHEAINRQCDNSHAQQTF